MRDILEAIVDLMRAVGRLGAAIFRALIRGVVAQAMVFITAIVSLAGPVAELWFAVRTLVRVVYDKLFVTPADRLVRMVSGDPERMGVKARGARAAFVLTLAFVLFVLAFVSLFIAGMVIAAVLAGG